MKGPLILALGALVVGAPLACGNATRTEVKSVPERWDPPPEGQALVVLARPDEDGWGEAFLVVNDQGKFVAEVPAASRVHVLVPAGRSALVGWASKVMQEYGWSSRVELDTLPGRAYFVYVRYLQNGFQLVTEPESLLTGPGCPLELEALAAKRVESSSMSAAEYLDDGKVKTKIGESREWLEELGKPAERQRLGAFDGILAAHLPPEYRRTDPIFCRPPPLTHAR